MDWEFQRELSRKRQDIIDAVHALAIIGVILLVVAAGIVLRLYL